MSSYPPFFGEDFAACWPESAQAVVVPLPLERTVSYGCGTGRGPAAILAASEQLEFWEAEEKIDYLDYRIATRPPPALDGSVAAALEAIATAVRADFAAGRFVLGLGGEHSVTVGLLRALGRPEVAVVQLDAHADLRDAYGGTPYSHACVMRRAVEMGHSCIGIGVRSLSREEGDYIAETAYPILYRHTLDPAGSWMEPAIAGLPPEVYLSLDVDVLDPSVMPGTGTPEPDGLRYTEVVRFIEKLAAQRRIVGADLVEVAPVPGMQVSEFTAAKLAAVLLTRAVRSHGATRCGSALREGAS